MRGVDHQGVERLKLHPPERRSHQLGKNLYREGHAYLKAGVGLIELVDREHYQHDLLHLGQSEKTDRLMRAIDAVNRVKGKGSVFLAAQGVSKPCYMRRQFTSPEYNHALVGYPGDEDREGLDDIARPTIGKRTRQRHTLGHPPALQESGEARRCSVLPSDLPGLADRAFELPFVEAARRDDAPTIGKGRLELRDKKNRHLFETENWLGSQPRYRLPVQLVYAGRAMCVGDRVSRSHPYYDRGYRHVNLPVPECTGSRTGSWRIWLNYYNKPSLCLIESSLKNCPARMRSNELQRYSLRRRV